MANPDILEALVGMIADAVIARIGPQTAAARQPAQGKGGKGKSNRFSPEAIARMRASAKLRWARARKGEGKAAAPAKASGKKRKFSPEAIARMRAAARQRWAKSRKG